VVYLGIYLVLLLSPILFIDQLLAKLVIGMELAAKKLAFTWIFNETAPIKPAKTIYRSDGVADLLYLIFDGHIRFDVDKKALSYGFGWHLWDRNGEMKFDRSG
jgi:hypothetical protein